MNITSYNVTDVGYHYIGLRVLNGLPTTARRDEQTGTISRNVRKYVADKALRLLLPEPRGTFETAGEKICQELVHLRLVGSVNRAYEMTDDGKEVLALLDGRKNIELRRLMAEKHLRTFDNLRLVVKTHMKLEAVWRPVVTAEGPDNREYIASLLAPTFGQEADEQAGQVLSMLNGNGSKKLEDTLRLLVLRKVLPEIHLSEAMFRSMCDRLVSLRLLNQKRSHQGTCDFLKTYSPCVEANPPNDWYSSLDVRLTSGENFRIFFCEPNMSRPSTLHRFLDAVYQAFTVLTPTAGYFDLPQVRDTVSERLKIPEAAFDEGLNRVLDLEPCPLTVGLQYERATGRRKPLVRDRGSTQIYNLIRGA